MMHERMRKDAPGAILCDAEAAPQVAEDWFSAEYWRERNHLRVHAGGRGGVAFIETPLGDCVLRHYRRGGLLSTSLGDRYLWTGADRTRPFREYRLLAEIAQLELPGPIPIAARYRRQGVFYRADLITRRIVGARTLAECLASRCLDRPLAEKVGALIGRFHRAGIWHADLNAHNVLVAPDGLHLIDFDRGRARVAHAGWQQANLRRLRRSLVKLGATRNGEASFEHTIWQPLLKLHGRTLAS